MRWDQSPSSFTDNSPSLCSAATAYSSHLVVAADRWDNHASIWFIRRGHSGEPEDEIIRLQLDGDGWQSDGSSGGAPGADLTTRVSLEELANHFSRHYHHTKDEPIPFGFGSGSSFGQGRAAVRFQTVEEAATLTFSDREPRLIADHGYCLVGYSPNRPPTITALDARGKDLGSFTPKRNPHRHRRWLQHLGYRPRPPRQGTTLNQRRRWDLF